MNEGERGERADENPQRCHDDSRLVHVETFDSEGEDNAEEAVDGDDSEGEDTELAGERGKEAGQLAKDASPPLTVVDNVNTTVMHVD